MYIVVGDFDLQDGPTGQYAWMKDMDWDGQEEHLNSKWKIYYYISDDLNENSEPIHKVGAYTKEFENLKFAIIQAGGHLVAKT